MTDLREVFKGGLREVYDIVTSTAILGASLDLTVTISAGLQSKLLVLV